MLAEGIARRYARALLEVAQQADEVETVRRDLVALVALLAAEASRAGADGRAAPSGLRLFLEHRLVPADAKLALVDRVLGGRFSPAVVNLVRLLVEKRRERLLEAIAREYVRLAEAAQRVANVRVTSAVELPPAVLAGLRQSLERRLDRRVRLQPEVDPQLIGGLVLRVGGRVYDASVRRRLERLKERLGEPGLAQAGLTDTR